MVFWIDSDIDFTIEQVETLLAVPEEHKFCNGWYRSDYSDHAMCGMWDEDFFDKNSYMPFLSVKKLTEIAKEDPHAMIQVDFSGFGFTSFSFFHYRTNGIPLLYTQCA